MLTREARFILFDPSNEEGQDQESIPSIYQFQPQFIYLLFTIKNIMCKTKFVFLISQTKHMLK